MVWFTREQTGQMWKDLVVCPLCQAAELASGASLSMAVEALSRGSFAGLCAELGKREGDVVSSRDRAGWAGVTLG